MKKFLYVDETNGSKKIGALIEPIPAGTIVALATNVVPTGYLLCNGANNVNKAIYNKLFNAIRNGLTDNTYWGIGIDIDHFKIPDLNGRFLAGATISYPVGNLVNDLTGKNGLNFLTPSTVPTVSGSPALSSGVAGANGSHGHTASGTFRISPDDSGSGGIVSGDYDSSQSLSYFGWEATSSLDGTHSHGVSGVISMAHSHSLSVTIGSGDIETRPVNSAINYYIKY